MTTTAEKNATAAIKLKTRVERSTIYALNENGTNAYSMQVQPGFLVIDGKEHRLTEEECELLAVTLQHAIQYCYGVFQKG